VAYKCKREERIVKRISARLVLPKEHKQNVKIRVGLVEALLQAYRGRSLVPHEREHWNGMVSHFASELARIYPRSFQHDQFIQNCGGLFWSD